VALDTKNGRRLWANTTISDPIGYASLVPATIAGTEQVIGMSARRVFAVRIDNGQLLWQFDFGNNRNNNATDIIVHNEQVYASSGYGKGSILIHPRQQADGQFTVKPVWTSISLDNHHGGVILLDGYLYGSGHEAKGWTCLAFSNGTLLWQAPGKGSLTYADGHLYCLDEKGSMHLVQPSPEKWQVISSFTIPRGGQGAFWAHPVVCGGRLYIRHSEKLYAYTIGTAQEADDKTPVRDKKPKPRGE
jgi:outer membrane protein assembly factor BamB